MHLPWQRLASARTGLPMTSSRCDTADAGGGLVDLDHHHVLVHRNDAVLDAAEDRFEVQAAVFLFLGHRLVLEGQAADRSRVSWRIGLMM